MTPDELFTRIHNLQREVNAVKAAQESLMIALPARQQELWLQALHAQLTTRASTLQELADRGANTTGLQAQLDAIQTRMATLDTARRAFVVNRPEEPQQASDQDAARHPKPH